MNIKLQAQSSRGDQYFVETGLLICAMSAAFAAMISML